MQHKEDLRGLTRAELEAALAALGEKPSHALNIIKAVHRGAAAGVAAIPLLPPRVIKALEPRYYISPLASPEKMMVSPEGDHEGESHQFRRVRRRVLPVASSSTYICGLPERSETKATWVPSGDHVGEELTPKPFSRRLSCLVTILSV